MTQKKPHHEEEWVQRAAMSLAKMVDEYTHRGWNEKGLADFAHIVERRLKRFVPPAPAALGTPEGDRRASVQGYSAGIPWSMHLRAYDAYCQQHGPQRALIEGGCRGGFCTKELDDFIPGWREELSTLASQARTIAALSKALVRIREELPLMTESGGFESFASFARRLRMFADDALKEHPNG